MVYDVIEPIKKRKLRAYLHDELREAIEHGAKCVKYHYCYSAIYVTWHGESDVYVVRGWIDSVRTGLKYTLGTALSGWWGFFGIIFTPLALVNNLTGGEDVTKLVMMALDSDDKASGILGHEFKPISPDLDLGPPQPAEEFLKSVDAQSPDEFLKSLENDNRG